MSDMGLYTNKYLFNIWQLDHTSETGPKKISISSWLISISPNIWKWGHNSGPGRKKVVLHLVVRPYKDIINGIKENYRFAQKCVSLCSIRWGLGPASRLLRRRSNPKTSLMILLLLLVDLKLAYMSYLDQLKSYLHPSEGLLVVWLAITHPCLHL